MKKIKLTLVFVALGTFSIALNSCSNSALETEESVSVNAENVVVADYSVEGMVCAMGCAKTIQDELAAMNGVVACDVDFDNGKAHIEYDKSQLDEKDLIAVIEGLAEGKYKVSEWNGDVEAEKKEAEFEVEESENSEGSTGEVSLPSFEMPNLLDLLLNQI